MAQIGESASAIETHKLRKTYRTITGKRVVAVAGLDLTVPRGGVHAFLGPNGSGKTTTIRMLLGLIRPDSGSMSVLGQPIPRALPAVVQHVGAIVEQPKFYPFFSGRENLIQLAMAIGVSRKKVDEVLEAVQLTERAKNQYRTYSLGMKQRLAIAATLLKDPELLIFDEPTNGLDPAGIREIRDMMRGLGAQGKTVLVSSHILAEVEQVADTVSIIGRGTVLAEGRVTDLIAAKDSHQVRVGLPATSLAAAFFALQSSGFDVRGEGSTLLVTGADDPAAVNRTLAKAGLYANHLVAEKAGLEKIFLELTQNETPGGQQQVAGPLVHNPPGAAGPPPTGSPHPDQSGAASSGQEEN